MGHFCTPQGSTRAYGTRSHQAFFDLPAAKAVILIKIKGSKKRTNKKPYFLYY
jgi:hypothetical protein